MRLIDADEFARIFNDDSIPYFSDFYGYGYTYKEVMRILNVTPTAKTADIKHGTWIGESDGYADGAPVYDVWHCSECGYTIDDGTDDENDLPNYCPHCGAKMREVENE